MMKKIMMKVGDNRGMTLIEVTVALVLFVFVFAILAYGMSGALKVMIQGNAVKDAGNNASTSLDLGVAPVDGSVTIGSTSGLTNLELKSSLYKKEGTSERQVPDPSDTTKTTTSVVASTTMMYMDAASIAQAKAPKAPGKVASNVLTWKPYPPTIGDIPVENNSVLDTKGLNVAVDTMNNFTDIVQSDGKIYNPPQNNLGLHNNIEYDRIVFTSTTNFGGNSTASSCGQLFFLGNTDYFSVNQSSQGVTSNYNTKFAYFNYGIFGHKNGDVYSEFILNNFTDSKGVSYDKVLIYFANDTKVQLLNQNEKTVFKEYSIKAGFYLVPSGTDLLLVAKDTNLQAQFVKNVSAGGYYLPTSGSSVDLETLKQELIKRDVKMCLSSDASKWGTVGANSQFNN